MASREELAIGASVNPAKAQGVGQEREAGWRV